MVERLFFAVGRYDKVRVEQSIISYFDGYLIQVSHVHEIGVDTAKEETYQCFVGAH